MDARQQYIDYMEELARRHVEIAHDPSSVDTRRFFLETDYEQLMGANEPNNTGWNLVLMGYETKTDDNKHGRRVERVSCIFDILRHSSGQTLAHLQETYTLARLIGEEVLARMDKDMADPCEADLSPGILPPYSMRWETKRTLEVGPRWDNYYGYRFALDIMQDDQVMLTVDPLRWRSI